MEIRAITVNATGTAAERGIQGIGLPSTNRAETENRSAFGPECRVTISQEGKNLSRRHEARTLQAEASAQDTQAVQAERILQRLKEDKDQDRDINEKYRNELDEIDRKINTLNSTKLSDEDFVKQQKLLEGMRNMKAFQAEQNQKNAKAAREMAMQSAGYKDEIDENNRELVTLLRTIKEAEKAEEERENGKTADGGNGDNGGSGVSGSNGIAPFGTVNSAGDVINGAAVQFMMSSVKREWNSQEAFADLAEEGRWMVDHADNIARNVLTETENLRAALDDEAFSDEQIDEMMRLLRDGTANKWFAEEARKRGWTIGMELNYKDIAQNRNPGQWNLTFAQAAKVQHDEKNPLSGMMQTKKDMMQSAIDADLGVERRNSIDETSRKLEEEVKKLIDERNDIDRIPEDKKEDEEQPKKLWTEQPSKLQEE